MSNSDPHFSDHSPDPNASANAEEADAQLEQSIRAGREFSLAEVIGREAGDFMKGASPIPPLKQARNKIEVCLEEHLTDLEGILKLVLQDWINDEARLARHVGEPLNALQEQLDELLSRPHLLYELVRQVDVKWGNINQERPHFQRPGQRSHPEDPYTHESVSQALQQLRDRIRSIPQE